MKMNLYGNTLYTALNDTFKIVSCFNENANMSGTESNNKSDSLQFSSFSFSAAIIVSKRLSIQILMKLKHYINFYKWNKMYFNLSYTVSKYFRYH